TNVFEFFWRFHAKSPQRPSSFVEGLGAEVRSNRALFYAHATGLTSPASVFQSYPKKRTGSLHLFGVVTHWPRRLRPGHGMLFFHDGAGDRTSTTMSRLEGDSGDSFLLRTV